MSHGKKVLTYKNKIVFEKVQIPYFKRMPKISHDDEACFMFINEGEFSVRTPSEFISYNKEKGLLAKCIDFFFETTHIQRTTSEYVEVIGVLLHPTILEELFQFDIKKSNHKVDYNVIQIHVNELMTNFKESLNILLDNPELADEDLIKTKLKEFVLLMCKTQNAPTQLDFLSAMFKRDTSEFSTIINSNLYSNLSIDEFSHLCGMSSSSFKRKFKNVFQQSPKRYMLKMKLEKACKALESSQDRISDIAYNCGFETISTFNRSFKKQFGKSPTEYRLDVIA